MKAPAADRIDQPGPSPARVVAIGASAGGVEALRSLCAALPPDLPAAVLVVLHVPRSAPSALPGILTRSGPLPAHAAIDGEVLRPGLVYVAPVDRHLLIVENRVRLSVGPAENGHRPAIDPLFRSVARAFGPESVGVVLSGSRDDGAAGLTSIAAHGGVTMVQEPADALYPSMPLAALDQIRADHVLPAAKLAGVLGEISRVPPGRGRPGAADPLLDAEVAMSDLGPVTTADVSGAPAGYGCPDCGGALFELPGAVLPRYRCRVGHAWSPESLLDEQTIALESALWMALRALEEKSELSRRMAVSQPDHRGLRAMRLRAVAEDAKGAGALIRTLIERIGTAADGPLRSPVDGPSAD
ncbi:MAG TPA: chemotaxis protein CheB [Catenuloplanes sp.]